MKNALQKHKISIYIFLRAKAYRSMTSGVEGHRISGDRTRSWFCNWRSHWRKVGGATIERLVWSIHDAYENTWKCGGLKLYFSHPIRRKKNEEKKKKLVCCLHLPLRCVIYLVRNGTEKANLILLRIYVLGAALNKLHQTRYIYQVHIVSSLILFGCLLLECVLPYRPAVSAHTLYGTSVTVLPCHGGNTPDTCHERLFVTGVKTPSCSRNSSLCHRTAGK